MTKFWTCPNLKRFQTKKNQMCQTQVVDFIKERVEKHCGKRKIMPVTSIFFFFT